MAWELLNLVSDLKKYSQLDMEALAIIFGVTRFHQYLYGMVEFVVYYCGQSLLQLMMY